MINNTEFNVYNKPQTALSKSPTAELKPQELTPGLWQKEALDTVSMYGRNEGKFSPVGKQLTLFPMDPVAESKPVLALDLDAPNVPVSHWTDFRFFGQDAQRLHLKPVGKPVAPPLGNKAAEHAIDAVSATQGELLVDGLTQMKEDQFPGRVQYTKGGLYPDGDKNSAKVIEQHSNAPNYRKVPGKRIHGVGQPTAQGFKDVLEHINKTNGKKSTVVWTNTRAEGVIYIDNKPYNLRELGSNENLVLKEGATGAELEAYERKLKEVIMAKGSIQVPVEGAKGNEPKFRTVTVSADNVKTTEDLVQELKKDYDIEYKRIPLADEKSPTPAQLDELREWANEAKARHPGTEPDFVFNCHQGRGRTTTGMVATGIAQEGKTKQLELPFGITVGENAQGRADRVIDEAYHMQNLRETVAETKTKAGTYADQATTLEKQAAREQDIQKKEKLEEQAKVARREQVKYETRATDFTQRYATMQKYSEYIDKFGAETKDPSFETWMKQDVQVEDLSKKWVALNTSLGLPTHSDVMAA